MHKRVENFKNGDTILLAIPLPQNEALPEKFEKSNLNKAF